MMKPEDFILEPSKIFFLQSLVIPFIHDFQAKNKKIIHIKDSKREDLQDVSQKTKLRVLSFENLDEKADLIIGDFPFWQRGDLSQINLCLNSLSFLQKNGLGIYLFPDYASTFQYKDENSNMT